VTVAMLGIVISMLATTAVNDPDPRQQQITTLLLPLPAAGAVTLGTLLASQRLASDVVFVAIMFTATYIRRFGPRWIAFGMLAFITYFFALVSLLGEHTQVVTQSADTLLTAAEEAVAALQDTTSSSSQTGELLTAALRTQRDIDDMTIDWARDLGAEERTGAPLR
jgi:cell division protein FtsW (lipid II flippase)